jgi:hypothetical protein
MATLRNQLRTSGSFDGVRLDDLVAEKHCPPGFLDDTQALVTPTRVPGVSENDTVPAAEACVLMAGSSYWDLWWEAFLTCRETGAGDESIWDWKTATFVQHMWDLDAGTA